MLGESGEGFAAGAHLIDAYGAGGFRFAGMSHKGSILVTATGIHAWAATTVEEIAPGTLGPILGAPAGSIEFLLIGTGEQMRPISQLVRTRLKSVGIRCDPMATGAAARTYNILIAERRLVAAALLAVP